MTVLQGGKVAADSTADLSFAEGSGLLAQEAAKIKIENPAMILLTAPR